MFVLKFKNLFHSLYDLKAKRPTKFMHSKKSLAFSLRQMQFEIIYRMWKRENEINSKQFDALILEVHCTFVLNMIVANICITICLCFRFVIRLRIRFTFCHRIALSVFHTFKSDRYAIVCGWSSCQFSNNNTNNNHLMA